MNKKIEYWVIPVQGKRILIKAERFKIEDGFINFYIELELIAFFSRQNITGVTINEVDEMPEITY